MVNFKIKSSDSFIFKNGIHFFIAVRKVPIKGYFLYNLDKQIDSLPHLSQILSLSQEIYIMSSLRVRCAGHFRCGDD